MNHKSKLLTIISVLLSSMMAYANNDIVVSLTEDYDPYQNNGTSTKHRTKSKQVTCIIADNGVTIADLSSDDIFQFEVYDSTDNCIESFTSESDFIDFVFHSSGEFKIRLYTDDFVFKGKIEL
jgi:hypothetical protein